MNLPAWLRSNRGRAVVASVFVFVATVVTFADAINNGFVNYDDWPYIYDKRTLRGLTLDNVIEAFTGIILGNYHPLAWLSHMADVEFFGLDPRGHHAVNVLLHGACAVALLHLLRRIGAGMVAAMFLTLWFALHPLRVESVAWVSERKDLLCALFYVLSVWLWVAPLAGGRRRLLPIALMTTAAMLSKPMAVSLPVAFALCERFAIGAPLSQVVRRTVPWFVLAGLLAAMTLYAQSQGMQSTALFPLSTRLQTFFVAHGAYYLPSTLAPDCLYTPYLYPDAWSPVALTGSVALVLGMIAGAWWLRTRFPLVPLGVAWYLLAMVPVSGLVMVGIAPAADRYTYIPTIGLLIAAIPLTARLGPLLAGVRGPALAGGGVVLLSEALLCQPQIQVWRSTRMLFEHALTCEPDHPHVLEFVASMDIDVGHLDDAHRRTVRALELRDNLPDLWNQLGRIELMRNNPAAARDAYVESLSWHADQKVAHLGLSVALEALGESAAAEAEFALGVGPESSGFDDRALFATRLDALGRRDRAARIRADAAAGRGRRSFEHPNVSSVGQPKDTETSTPMTISTIPNIHPSVDKHTAPDMGKPEGNTP